MQHWRKTTPDKQPRDFVHHWFKAFDQLPQDPAWFVQHADDALHLMTPDGTFRGTDGFRQWYQTLRLSFKPGIDHQLERIEVSHLEKNHYQVNLLVRIEAETLNSEATTIMAREVRRIAIDPQDNIKIFDYRVELV